MPTKWSMPYQYKGRLRTADHMRPADWASDRITTNKLQTGDHGGKYRCRGNTNIRKYLSVTIDDRGSECG